MVKELVMKVKTWVILFLLLVSCASSEALFDGFWECLFNSDSYANVDVKPHNEQTTLNSVKNKNITDTSKLSSLTEENLKGKNTYDYDSTIVLINIDHLDSDHGDCGCAGGCGGFDD